MKYLFRIWNGIRDRLEKAPHIFLGLDYDGTLTPIVKRPELAVLSDSMRSLLKTLSQKKNLTLAILSGRSLKDIGQQVRLKDIYYSGNHGFEIYLPQGKIISRYSAASLRTIRKFLPQLKVPLKEFSGVLIEDKGITLSVHYRNVPDYLEKPIINKVRLVHQQFARKIRLIYGKKVIEIRPRNNEQTKGKVFRLLMKTSRSLQASSNPTLRRGSPEESRPSLPIYLGDDTTDEDVFRVIKAKGLGIYVGGPVHNYVRGQARFFLTHQREVVIFLRRLLRLSNL